MIGGSIDWALLRSFLAVADHGSLSGAARALQLTQPTLGRHVAELEAQLRTRLFTRSARGLIPTEAALELLPHARLMASTAAALARAASGEAEDERGTVRVAASDIIGAEVLPPIIAAFRRAHPKIEVELVLSNRNENLLQREADIAIRMVRPTQQHLVARKIGDVPVRLFAHRSYVKRHGVPTSLAELRGHDLIGYDRIPALFEGANVIVSAGDFCLRSDNDLAQLALLRAGAGIGGMQTQMGLRDKAMVPVLHRHVVLPLEMWLVMHEDLRESRRVRLMHAFLDERLAAYVRGTPSARQ
jgi:DNA-binding transcriptional LysR family regulator